VEKVGNMCSKCEVTTARAAITKYYTSVEPVKFTG